MEIHWFLWMMMGIQVVGWLWGITWKAGKLTDKQYIAWCISMLFGQSAGAVDCLIGKAYGTMFLQMFFFISTVIGAVVRFRRMRSDPGPNPLPPKSS
jgi:hypothetical protein